jgi:uncharacterized membrane protein
MRRMLRHLLTTRWNLRRRFPRASLRAIQAAIGAAEREHGGEIRFAIETCLDLRRLRAGESARQRALEVFARLRVWDTEARNGVLIYVLLADRDIEIVADRGFRALVSAEEWEAVCRAMEAEFRAGRYEAGALAGIRSVSALIARHFAPSARDLNELPDAPQII